MIESFLVYGWRQLKLGYGSSQRTKKLFTHRKTNKGSSKNGLSNNFWWQMGEFTCRPCGHFPCYREYFSTQWSLGLLEQTSIVRRGFLLAFVHEEYGGQLHRDLESCLFMQFRKVTAKGRFFTGCHSQQPTCVRITGDVYLQSAIAACTSGHCLPISMYDKCIYIVKP